MSVCVSLQLQNKLSKSTKIFIFPTQPQFTAVSQTSQIMIKYLIFLTKVFTH